MGKDQLVVDEMFPDLTNQCYMDIDDISTNNYNYLDFGSSMQQTEKISHADFFNKFEDLFDDDDLE